MGRTWPVLRALGDQGVHVRMVQRACAELGDHTVPERACCLSMRQPCRERLQTEGQLEVRIYTYTTRILHGAVP